MDALQLRSWAQESDIELIIRLKLQQQALRMDIATQSKLEDFIRMKQTKETMNLTSKQRKKGSVRRINYEPTVQICNDLTKWLKDNQDDFMIDTTLHPISSQRSLGIKAKSKYAY